MEKRQANSFYQHFDESERPTVDYFVGLFNQFLFKNEPILTDFLNPREQYIFREIVGGYAQLYSFGGFSNAEKKRMLLCEWSEGYKSDKFNISLLEIAYPQKWSELTHSQILGVLTHLGIELDTFGDIINDENGNWQFFVKAELKDYFLEEIDRIGRTKVKLSELPLSKVLVQEDDSEEMTSVAISLRLDAVISAITNLSRSQVKKIIEAGEVKLNWHLVTQSNIIISVQDMLSIRHYGRYEIINLATTKKGKKRLEIKVWQAKKR